MPRIILIAVFVYGLCSAPALAQQQNDSEHQAARAALISLAAASASLQAYDAYSTLSALNLGAVEANPAMRAWLAGPPRSWR
ncbi:MAG TPA: hypothetical protein VGJ78_24360 [Vicinamibacterales bacterium]|jgi:2-methylcitrate dehydratase PrpD